MSRMASPFEGEVSAHFRGYPGHNGTDIRPAKRYTYGNPVAAMLPGIVVDVVKHQKKGDKDNGIGRSYDIGFMTGNGCIIQNADGEHQVYNHIMPNVSIGDGILAGEIIGKNDDSGNQTGAHIHLEYRRKNKDGLYAPVDIMYLFNLYDVKPGDPVDKVLVKPVSAKPKPPAAKKYITVKQGSRNDTVGKVQAALRKKRYVHQIVDDVFGEQTEFNIKHFQRNNGLYEDGIAGEKTQRKLGL